MTSPGGSGATNRATSLGRTHRVPTSLLVPARYSGDTAVILVRCLCDTRIVPREYAGACPGTWTKGCDVGKPRGMSVGWTRLGVVKPGARLPSLIGLTPQIFLLSLKLWLRQSKHLEFCISVLDIGSDYVRESF